ncbi:MAG: PilN domain-containing protein [Chloroflexi bacterium]|nr:PilN domain-containing protein [Chloroflexota bacterium]
MTVRNSLDIDSVLARTQPSTPSRRPLILWLIMFGLLMLFVPLYLVAAAIGANANQLQSELDQAQLALVSGPTPDLTTEAIQTQVNQVVEEAGQLDAIQANLDNQQTDWPAVIAAINNYQTGPLTLTGLTQTENRLTITGAAANDAAVITYAQQLEASGQFQRVIVQSIALLPTPQATATLTPTHTVTPSPTVAPLPTPTPGSSGGTSGTGGSGSVPVIPTANPKDAFEPDDITPKPIFVGQLQAHNFYPTFDVDNSTFLAKSGRTYAITTAGLAPGVDTFLSVTIGDIVLTNDDSKPGTLASEMIFQVPGGDIPIFVQITNRGQFGPEMTYQLFVQEVVLTPVPTTVPGPTATTPPQPTATPTITSTPDLRDAYEPDEGTPATIIVGESQLHNFYPAGDVDRVQFITKAGRFYQVATANLTLGVDTFLQAGLEGNQWQNDDYAPPGTGNFASSVCFPATVDSTALVTVTNKMQLYNPSLTYNVGVVEVPALYLNLNQLTFGPVIAGSPNPLTQTVLLTGDSTLSWTATTGSNWLDVGPTSGAAPAWINVRPDITGLPPGHYEDTVTFAWASLCQRVVTVTLQIDPPPPSTISAYPESPFQPVSASPFTTIRTFPLAKPPIQGSPGVSFIIIVELNTP